MDTHRKDPFLWKQPLEPQITTPMEAQLKCLGGNAEARLDRLRSPPSTDSTVLFLVGAKSQNLAYHSLTTKTIIFVGS